MHDALESGLVLSKAWHQDFNVRTCFIYTRIVRETAD